MAFFVCLEVFFFVGSSLAQLIALTVPSLKLLEVVEDAVFFLVVSKRHYPGILGDRWLLNSFPMLCNYSLYDRSSNIRRKVQWITVQTYSSTRHLITTSSLQTFEFPFEFINADCLLLQGNRPVQPSLRFTSVYDKNFQFCLRLNRTRRRLNSAFSCRIIFHWSPAFARTRSAPTLHLAEDFPLSVRLSVNRSADRSYVIHCHSQFNCISFTHVIVLLYNHIHDVIPFIYWNNCWSLQARLRYTITRSRRLDTNIYSLLTSNYQLS